MQEAQVSGVQLLKPGEYPAIDLVDEDRWRSRYRCRSSGCFSNRYHTQFQDVLATPGHRTLCQTCSPAFNSSAWGCRAVARRSVCRGCPSRPRVNLGANPPRLRPIHPFWGSSRRAMRPDHRAVDDQVFQIRVVAAMLMHLCPDALVSPTGESSIRLAAVAIGPQSIHKTASTKRRQSASWPTYRPVRPRKKSRILAHCSGDSLMFDIQPL